jgi:hypothetical protein
MAGKTKEARMKSQRIPIADIQRDMLLQPRAELHRDWIEEYATEMLAGAKFPPVVVYFDGKKYWLSDGFHRLYGAEAAGMDAVRAEVREGSRRDALLHSLSVNAEHGHRRTNEDKRRAIDIMLDDRQWTRWSDSQIATQCGVDHKTVAARRSTRNSILGNSQDGARIVTRAGTTYEMNTANIGTADQRANVEAAVEAEADEAKDTPEPFDWEAAKLRNSAMEAIRAIAALPSIDDVIAAWVKSNSYGEPIETLEKAHVWLGNFINRYRVVEPQRWARVQTQHGDLANAAE